MATTARPVRTSVAIALPGVAGDDKWAPRVVPRQGTLDGANLSAIDALVGRSDN
jgi:hypothetical protein